MSLFGKVKNAALGFIVKRFLRGVAKGEHGMFLKSIWDYLSGKKTWAKPAVAKFGFSSPTAGATFQCKLDKGKWKTCTSKHKVKTKKLKTGKHTLRVRAVLAGTVDPTPSVKKFKVTG